MSDKIKEGKERSIEDQALAKYMTKDDVIVTDYDEIFSDLQILAQSLKNISSRSCRTCAFWKDPDVLKRGSVAGGYVKPRDWETDELIQFDFEVRVCNHPDLVFCERPQEEDGFGICDASEYAAAFMTGEKFCCSKYVSYLSGLQGGTVNGHMGHPTTARERGDEE